MCLAVPGKIISVNGEKGELTGMARISFGGVVKEASLELVPEAKIGDYVLVHVGVAISIVDEDEAQKTFEYLEKIGELNELEEGESHTVDPES